MIDRKAALKQDLQESRDALMKAVAGLSAAQWARPTAAEGWSVKDVFAHLAYNQAGQGRLIRNILDGKGGTPANFDLEYYNRRGVEKQKEKSVEQLSVDLAASQADLLALVDALNDAQLDAQGTHASVMREVTVEEILRTVARHDREHTGHITDALK
ncbi:MAG: DinB family protein [Chloroflexi bacterium]|nr:DinB family protein [Chloroflexota bacterium]